MSSWKKYRIFDKPISDVNLDNCRIINTINPHSYCIAENDSKFQKVLIDSDILLPDGIGIVWAKKFLEKKVIKKIAGFDIFIYIMNYLNDNEKSCFFLGASDTTLNLIKLRISKEYPNIKVNSYSPPYKDSFTDFENREMIDKINNFKPEVLFVGMTAPKQEKWVYEHKEFISANIICSIGAVFDFYAGTVKRPGAIWIKLGLEWLPRFLKEPKRLARRNLISTPKFLLIMMKLKLLNQY